MKSFTLASTLGFALFAQTQAQWQRNPDGTMSCVGLARENFCASNGDPNNIIIRCNNGVGIAGNCNNNLAGVDPVGVKTDALCKESSSVAGDAACWFNGVAYPDVTVVVARDVTPAPEQSTPAAGYPTAPVPQSPSATTAISSSSSPHPFYPIPSGTAGSALPTGIAPTIGANVTGYPAASITPAPFAGSASVKSVAGVLVAAAIALYAAML